VRGREAVHQAEEDGLGVRVGRVPSDRVEHGIAKRRDLLFLVGVVDRPGSWAPDGSDLLYQYQTWNDDCTASPTNISAVYGNVVSQPGDAAADYSPDGTRIVLTSTLPGQKGNIIIESNTGANRRTLTQRYEPSWQPLP
jgi:hypothetical protein